MEASDLHVKSNILLGAVNVALVVLVYAFIVVLGHFYLLYFQNINIMELLQSVLIISEVPFIGELFKFSEHLLISIVTDAFLVGLIYAAYISNHELKVKGDVVETQEGFLLVNKEKFKLEDIEQVYVEKYNFFPKAGALCIKAINEDTVKIPYVYNAKKDKDILVEMIKERQSEIQIDETLKDPIRVVT